MARARALAVALALACVCPVLAENLDPEPTGLESFANRHGSRIVHARSIGHIEVAPARLTVSALTVQSTFGEVVEMRGVRIELVNARTRDTLFLDEGQVRDLKRSLAELKPVQEPTFSIAGQPVPLQVNGTQACHRPQPVLHVLCPETYSSEEGAGLRVHALRGEYYWFPGNDPAMLDALLGRALIELQKQLDVRNN